MVRKRVPRKKRPKENKAFGPAPQKKTQRKCVF